MKLAALGTLPAELSTMHLRQREPFKMVEDHDAHVPLIRPDEVTSSSHAVSESDSSNSSIEKFNSRHDVEDLGETILKVEIPYKHSDDAHPIDIKKSLTGQWGVITARPRIGHHVPDARLELPHGSAFLKVDNDRRSKLVTLSVLDPAACMHPLFRNQVLRQADMRQIIATIQSVNAVIERNALGYPRTCDSQDADLYKLVKYKKTLPE
jgi:hypothetical protein